MLQQSQPENNISTFTVTRTTLKKTVNIFLLVFYVFGAFCLPMGDFSALMEIPEMYRHCKSTEDKDMTAIDFITDHLVNIDGIFDKHDNGDEQKPHEPLQQQQHLQPTVFFVSHHTFAIKSILHVPVSPALLTVYFLPSDYISKIFRPPIR